MRYVGIDWAHGTHVVAVIDEMGRQLACRPVKHTAKDLSALLKWLDEVAPLSGGRMIAIESGAPLLSDMLQELDQPLFVVNPMVLDRYRDRFNPAGAKDDKKDARTLADLIRTDSDRMTPLQPDSDLATELRLVVRARTKLVNKRTALTNELTGALRVHYPSAVGLASHVYDRWYLEFLRRFPDAASASAAPPAEVQAILDEYGVRKWTAESLLKFLRAEALPVRKPVARAYARITADVTDQIKVLMEQIAAIEREIDALLKQHPDRDLILSLPGVQTTLAARILSEIGDHRSRHPDYASLQAFAGTAPVTRQSGKGRALVLMRRACNGHLRNALFIHASTSKAKSAWAKSYYNYLREHGRSHAMANRALANKWVKIIFTMLTRKVPYSEALHTENLRRSGVPWHPQEAGAAA